MQDDIGQVALFTFNTSRLFIVDIVGSITSRCSGPDTRDRRKSSLCSSVIEIVVLGENKIVSLPFCRQIFNFLSLKTSTSSLCFGGNKGFMPLREKQKYQGKRLARIAEFSLVQLTTNCRKTPE